MSMAWMRMPAQSWLSAAAMFLLMWVVMMVAMMLPSLAPILRHRESRWLVAIAYFFVWTIFGAVAYAIGIALAAAAMHWQGLARTIPAATAAALLLAGVVQITPWKGR